MIEGPRRIGKTSLARKTIRGGKLIEANLYGAKSSEQCEAIIVSAIEEYVGRSLAVESSVQGSGTLFGFGGSIAAKRIEGRDLMRQAFVALCRKAEDANEVPVLLIDEAQTFLEVKEGLDFAKRLRTQLQRSLHSMTAVFAGSNSSTLSKLHSKSSSPFYKQLEILRLGPLPRDGFYKWIGKRLSRHSLSLEREAFEATAEFCRDVCGDIQRVLNALYRRAESGATISLDDAEKAISWIADGLREDALPILNSMTQNQLALYLFLSVRDRSGSTVPTFGKIAQEAMGGLPGGTISKAMEGLARLGLVSYWDGRVYPDNPFLETMLIRANENAASKIAASLLRHLKP